MKSAGQLAYERAIAERPRLLTGAVRLPWEQLSANRRAYYEAIALETDLRERGVVR